MIRICTFGGLSIYNGTHMVCQNLGPITRELFSYLAVHSDASQRRERIAEMLWPEKTERRSRSSLNTALWRINGALKSARIDKQIAIVRASESAVVMSMGKGVALDCAQLSRQVEACAGAAVNGPLTREMRKDLEHALTRYSDAFMDGLGSEWVMRERERYRCLFERGMTILMREYALCGRLDEALACGATILESDALKETTQRAVMWLHVMNGQRGKAIEQYLTLRHMLREEVNVEPMPDTTLLYRHILGNDELAEAPFAGTGKGGQQRASFTEGLLAIRAQRASVLNSIFETDIERV